MKTVTIIILTFVLLLFSVNAFTVNTFDNGYGTENLTYTTSSGSYTRFVTIPRNILVSDSYINLKSFGTIINNTQSLVCDAGITNCSNINDSNYSTYANNNLGSNQKVVECYYVYNYSRTGITSFNKIGVHYDTFDYYGVNFTVTPAKTQYIKSFNTNGSYYTYLNDDFVFYGSTSLVCYNHTMGSGFAAPHGDQWTTYSDRFISTYPFNISLDVGSDNSTEYNKSFMYNYDTKINFSTNLTTIATSCVCPGCTVIGSDCKVPVKFKSGTGGILNYYSMFLNYSLTYNVTLIDERTGQPLDITKVQTAKIYQGNTLYNLKTASTNNIQLNFTSNTTFRLEMNIADGTLINKYFDVSTFSEDDLRICGNPENYTHYEQVILSVSQPIVKLYNRFADCYVTSDYTRFGYSTQNSLKAYTVESDYILYLNSNGTFIELIGIDGTTASSINIDTILFSQRDYNSIIKSDTMNVERLYPTNTTMKIYYKNFKEDNTGATLTITNLDTDNVVYTSSSFSDFNDITVYYDFVLDTYDNETLWKVELEKSTSQGTSTVTRFFNSQGNTGNMKSELAMTISIIILIFTFSTLIPDFSLSYMGIIACFGSLIVLFNAVPVYYITFMQGINLIIMLFIFTIMFTSKQKTLIT